MFGKLKEKLKKSLSIFSRKTEEEAEDIPKEEVEELIEKKKAEVAKEQEEKPEPVKEELAPIEKPEPVKEKPAEEKEEEVPEVIKEKPEPVKEAVEEEKPEEKVIEEESATVKVKPTEKKEEPTPEPEKVIEETPAPDEEPVEEKKEEPKPEPVKEKEIKKVEEPVEEKKEEVKEKPKKSLFGRFKEALTTKKISGDKFEDLFWDLELVLLESNVSVKVIERIKEDLKEELVDKPLPRDVPAKIKEVLSNTLKDILSIETFSLLDRIKEKNEKEGEPFVITFFGINGAGKTTTIAKLVHLLKENGITCVLAASDTFRAAAIQQLQEHADKLGVKMISHDYGSDAAAVAYDAVQYAKKNDVNAVLVDTAGRLHSNTNLMAELEKICRVSKPDLKIFIGESITGNDCIEQAEKFDKLINLDAAILSKADIDEDGCAPLSIAYTIKKPILYLGMGQEYKDLEEFNPDLILKRLGFD